MECLISKEPIIENITLPCHHSFEYIYLYEEIKVQKQRHKNYFKCPYCRSSYFETIPYYEIEGVEKINMVNHSKNTLPIHKCQWNNCLNSAHKYKHGLYCTKHMKTIFIKSCSARCINGSPCKNKCKINDLCNVHSKNKINTPLLLINV